MVKIVISLRRQISIPLLRRPATSFIINVFLHYLFCDMNCLSKAFRIFGESSFIAKTLCNRLCKRPITNDAQLNRDLTALFESTAEKCATSFVCTLFVIAKDMGFSEWTDFWYDMGTRIYGQNDDEEDDDLIDFK